MKVALAAVWDEKTLAKLAQQFGVYSTQITTWQGQLLEGAAEVFGSDSQSEPIELAIHVKTSHAKTGELGLVNDCVRGARQGGTVADRKTMTDWTHAQPVVRQARELGISSGCVCYLPRTALDAAYPPCGACVSCTWTAGCWATCLSPMASMSAACVRRC